MTAIFISVFYEPGYTFVAPTPCGIRCHCSTSWRCCVGNVAAGKGYKSCTRRFRIAQRWLIVNGWGFGRPVKRV